MLDRPAAQCTIAGKGNVDQGWVERSEAVAYQCVAIFDEAFKPAGAAWVKAQVK